MRGRQNLVCICAAAGKHNGGSGRVRGARRRDGYGRHAIEGLARMARNADEARREAQFMGRVEQGEHACARVDAALEVRDGSAGRCALGDAHENDLRSDLVFTKLLIDESERRASRAGVAECRQHHGIVEKNVTGTLSGKRAASAAGAVTTRPTTLMFETTPGRASLSFCVMLMPKVGSLMMGLQEKAPQLGRGEGKVKG